MKVTELILISIGLSMDAFALSMLYGIYKIPIILIFIIRYNI